MSLCACAGQRNEYSSFAMGSVLTAKINGDKTAADTAWNNVRDAVNRLDSLISATNDASDIAVVSKTGTVKAAPETIRTVKEALSICDICGGSVDITLGAVTELWGFSGDSPSLPSAEDIRAALRTKDLSGVSADEETGVLTCKQGQKLDLGAFGKGAACDAALDALKNSDVSSAVLTVGGSVLLHGVSPDKDAWSVGIRDPFGTQNDYFALLTLSEYDGKTDIFLSTSGNYEKTFEENGKTYHHILDPDNGYPAENGLVSVTAVCGSGMVSDALSTACFVNGLNDETLGWLNELNAQAVFIFEDGSVFATEGIKENLSILSDAFTLTDDYDAE